MACQNIYGSSQESPPWFQYAFSESFSSVVPTSIYSELEQLSPAPTIREHISRSKTPSGSTMHRQALLQLDLIIIGAGMSDSFLHFSVASLWFFAGIAGLATAFALARSGHRVRVFDKLDGSHQVFFLFFKSKSCTDIVNKSGPSVCASPQIYLKFFTLGVFTTNFRMLPDVAKLVSTQVSTHECYNRVRLEIGPVIKPSVNEHRNRRIRSRSFRHP